MYRKAKDTRLPSLVLPIEAERQEKEEEAECPIEICLLADSGDSLCLLYFTNISPYPAGIQRPHRTHQYRRAHPSARDRPPRPILPLRRAHARDIISPLERGGGGRGQREDEGREPTGPRDRRVGEPEARI